MRILLSIFAISILAVGLTGCSWNETRVGGSTSDSFSIGGDLSVSGETGIDTLIQGGGEVAITADGNTTLTAAQLCDYSHITVTPSTTTGNVNMTTPTAALLIADCIPTIGDFKVLFYENGATTATTTTMVAGSAVDLIEPSGGDVVIAQNEDARIEMLNLDGTNVKVIVTSLQAAD